jgi:hypothetical protein
MTHSFCVELAVKYGIESALIIGQIDYWCNKNKEKNRNFYNGRYWTYNTIKNMTDSFPYLTTRQVNYYIDKLKKRGAILTDNFNKNNLDKTTWYTLSDDVLSILRNRKMEFTKSSNGNDEIVKSVYNKDIQNLKQQIERTNLAPSLEEVKKFAKENSLISIVDKFYKYYSVSNWLDDKGKAINWKQKLLSWGNRETIGALNMSFPKKDNFKSREYDADKLNSMFQSIDEIDVGS